MILDKQFMRLELRAFWCKKRKIWSNHREGADAKYLALGKNWQADGAFLIQHTANEVPVRWFTHGLNHILQCVCGCRVRNNDRTSSQRPQLGRSNTASSDGKHAEHRQRISNLKDYFTFKLKCPILYSPPCHPRYLCICFFSRTEINVFDWKHFQDLYPYS